MSYSAIVCRLKNLRPHPNSSNGLQLGNACGEQVITGKEVTPDTLGVYFPSDGCLSHEMCRENNLFSKAEWNKDPSVKGYFGDNGRVKAQNFRGEKSYGFWIELPLLSWTGVDLSILKEGFEFTELEGKGVCQKWVNPETLRHHGKNREKIQKRLSNLLMFKEHFDTPHLKRCVGDIKPGSILYISRKAHGCVDKDSLVDTLEHGLMRIQEVVEGRLPVHIKSLSIATNEVEYTSVEDWYFYPNDDDWYEIELEDGARLTITGNNPVWLPLLGTYRRVEGLSAGDILLTLNSDGQQEQVATKRITKLAQRNDRYDLTVPKNHNFFANGILIHNTSGRTGHVLVEQPLTPFQGWWNRYFSWTGKRFTPKVDWEVVTGTRRVVLDPSKGDQGYYSGKKFRLQIHQMFKDLQIPRSLCFYYEICGYDETGQAIMPSQPTAKIEDKKLRKLVEKEYGPLMTYSYGCRPDDPVETERYRTFVYRITTTTPEGKVFDLPWPQVERVCSEYGLETVGCIYGPIVYKGIHPTLEDINPEEPLSQRYEAGEEERLLRLANYLVEGPEPLDPRHIREGICVRVETGKDLIILKNKSHLFMLLEQGSLSDPGTVDIEEAESLPVGGEEDGF